MDAGWGVRVTPVLKAAERRAVWPLHRREHQLQPGQAVLAEPIGTRRQETVSVLDFRVEKQVQLMDRARIGLFFDVFNALNSNTAVNIAWGSGASFERAATVLGPRIAKFGAKFDW